MISTTNTNSKTPGALSSLEINVLKWASMLSGWKKRTLFLDENSVRVIKSKTNLKKNNIRVFSLLEVKIVDDKKKQNQFLLIAKTRKKKYNFKVEKEEDKQNFIKKFEEYKSKLSSQNVNVESDNSNNDNNDNIEICKSCLSHLLSNIENINNGAVQLQLIEKQMKHKYREQYKEIISMLVLNGAEMKKIIDKILSTENEHKMNNAIIEVVPSSREDVADFSAALNSNDLKKDVMKQEKHENQKKDDNNNDDDDGSIIDQLDSSVDEDEEREAIAEIKSVREIMSESKQHIQKFGRALSHKMSDFYDSRYNFPKRSSIPLKIKCPDNFVKDMVKSMTSKKGSMPLEYNEPISMLQKQCEKFHYIDLLQKASESSVSSEMKIVYIIGFVCGELSQYLGRFLKPFNPILGETFEYFDNEKKYRFFSEQVSHNPPISAYVCESNEFVYFGDTRFKTSFKIMKGGMELSFTNKTHILFKTTDDSYVFTRPKAFASGFMNGKPKYDFEGKMEIVNVKNKKIRAEVSFHEDKSEKAKSSTSVTYKPSNIIDGTVYNGSEAVYKISGSWKDKVYYAEGKNPSQKKEVFSLDKEPFHLNTLENYVLPSYTLNYNYIDDELKKVIPYTDSRNRPDQREYENGNIEKAREMKNKIESNQRKRHEKFEEEKKVYEPMYFNNVFNEMSDDFVYVYKGGYYESREKGVFQGESKIFEL